MGDSQDAVTIAVMGATGAGKSTFVNLVSQSNLQVSDGLESCTQDIHVASPFVLDGRTVTIIDTPGFDDTHKDEAEILRLITEFLATTYKEGRKLNGVIFLHRISDARMTGVSQKNFRLFRKICGDGTLKNVVIVTTMWDTTAREVAERRERELAENPTFFKTALDRGAQMRRHNNTIDSARRILRTIMGFPPEILRIQHETVDEGKALVQTDAGRDLNAELARVEARYREEINRLKEEHQAATAQRSSEHFEEVRDLTAQLAESRQALQKIESEKKTLTEEKQHDKAATEDRLKRVWQEVTRREEDLRRVLGERDAYHLQAEEAKRKEAQEARRRELAEKMLDDMRRAGAARPQAEPPHGALGAVVVVVGLALGFLFRHR